MKTSLVLFLALAAVLLVTGCAGTTLYDRKTGKAIARFQGDMTNSDYADGGTRWKVAQVSHSQATIAGGHAVGHIIKKSFDGLTEAALAVGSGGASTALPAVIGKGAAVLPVFSNSSGLPATAPAVPPVKP